MKKKLQITIYLSAIILLLSVSLNAQVVGVNNFPTNGNVNIGNTPNPHSLTVVGTINTVGLAITGTATGITATMIGLGNVDNTSDTSKPISTATQTALNGKQATLVSGTTIKTINGTSVLGSGNIAITGATGPQGPAGSQGPTGATGATETAATIKTKLGITTLSGSNTGDQDLSGYAPLASPIFTGTTSVNILETRGNAIIGTDLNPNRLDVSGQIATGGDVTVGTVASPNNLIVTRDATITGTLTAGNIAGIKTINGESILGTGNISITGGAGSETAATIKTKLGISTLSGSNTGDQDLSGYATTTDLGLKAPLASPTFTGTTIVNTLETRGNVAIGTDANPNRLDVSGQIATGGDVTVGTVASPNNLIVTNNATITGTLTAGSIAGIKTINGESILGTGDISITGGTGSETATTIKTKLGITTLSGSNTGDQDLSGYAPLASPTFTGTTSVNALETRGNVTIGTDASPNNLTVTRNATVAGTLTSGNFFPSKIGIGVTDSLDALSVVGNGVFTGDIQAGSELRATTLSTTGDASIGGILTAGTFAPETISTKGLVKVGTNAAPANLNVSGNGTIGGNLNVGGGSGLDVFRVTGKSILDGNVGIGIGVPINGAVARLHVLDNSNTTSPNSGIVSESNSDAGGRITLRNTKKIGNEVSDWSIYNTTTAYGGGLQFWRYKAGENSAGSGMFISDEGNLGLGTDTAKPAERLHVVGNAKITGTLTAGSIAGIKTINGESILGTGNISITGGAGSETAATIKTKLGITTLSGSNTGDQDLSGYAPLASPTFTGTTSVNALETKGNVTIGTDGSPNNLTVTGDIQAKSSLRATTLSTTGDASIGGILTAGTFAPANIATTTVTADNVIAGSLTIGTEPGIAIVTNQPIPIPIANQPIPIANGLIIGGEPGVSKISSPKSASNFKTATNTEALRIFGGSVTIGSSGDGDVDKLLVRGRMTTTAAAVFGGNVTIGYDGKGTTRDLNVSGDADIKGTLTAGTFKPVDISTTGDVKIGSSDSKDTKRDLTVSGLVKVGTIANPANLNVTGNGVVLGNLDVGSGSGLDVFRVTGKSILTGNVGIGTGVPNEEGAAARLHVLDNIVDSTSPNSGIVSESNSAAGGRITLRNTKKTIANSEKNLGLVYDWSIYNTTTTPYGGGLQFWRFKSDGSSIGSGMFLSDEGNLGIGTDTAKPTERLHVVGNAKITGDASIEGILTAGTFAADNLSTTGKVTIGSPSITLASNAYKLFVEDGILTEKVKVAVKNGGNWSDYVFYDDYKLMPLADVEQYIKENNHLPNVLSASEMVKEGNDLGKTDAKLLEKIEELTLYMIEMKKEIGQLKKENEDLKNAVFSSNK